MCWTSVEVWKSLPCLSIVEAVEHRPARGDPADPQAAADDLRERVHVQHVRRAPLRAARSSARPRSAGRVDAVLEDEEVALARQLDQLRPALGGQVDARRVLARGLHRDQLHLVAGEHLLERVHVQAVAVDGNADDARPVARIAGSTRRTSATRSRRRRPARASRGRRGRSPAAPPEVTTISSAQVAKPCLRPPAAISSRSRRGPRG